MDQRTSVDLRRYWMCVAFTVLVFSCHQHVHAQGVCQDTDRAIGNAAGTARFSVSAQGIVRANSEHAPAGPDFVVPGTSSTEVAVVGAIGDHRWCGSANGGVAVRLGDGNGGEALLAENVVSLHLFRKFTDTELTASPEFSASVTRIVDLVTAYVVFDAAGAPLSTSLIGRGSLQPLRDARERALQVRSLLVAFTPAPPTASIVRIVDSVHERLLFLERAITESEDAMSLNHPADADVILKRIEGGQAHIREAMPIIRGYLLMLQDRLLPWMRVQLPARNLPTNAMRFVAYGEGEEIAWARALPRRALVVSQAPSNVSSRATRGELRRTDPAITLAKWATTLGQPAMDSVGRLVSLRQSVVQLRAIQAEAVAQADVNRLLAEDPLVPTILAGGPATLAALQTRVRQELVEANDDYGRLCASDPNACVIAEARLRGVNVASVADDARFDSGASWIVQTQSVVIGIPSFGDHDVRVQICRGSCTASTPDVGTVITLRPERRADFVVLGTLGYSVANWESSAGRWNELAPTSAMPGYEPLLHSRFQIGERGLQHGASFDLLLGVRFGWNFYAGLGPSMYDTRVSPFHHWRLAFGGRVPSLSRNLYILGLAGLMFADTPSVPDGADTFIVPRGDDGAGSPPQFVGTPHYAWSLGISIGIDIAGVGEAGVSLVKSFSNSGDE